MAALAATEDVTALLTRCRMDPKQIKQTAKNAKGIADRFARVARAGGVFGAYVFWCLFWCFGVSWFFVAFCGSVFRGFPCFLLMFVVVCLLPHGTPRRRRRRRRRRPIPRNVPCIPFPAFHSF